MVRGGKWKKTRSVVLANGLEHVTVDLVVALFGHSFVA